MKLRKLSTAQACIARYEELLAMANAHAEAHPYFTIDTCDKEHIKWSLKEVIWDGGSFRATWTHYIGCGEYDHETTYFGLDEIFPK